MPWLWSDLNVAYTTKFCESFHQRLLQASKCTKFVLCLLCWGSSRQTLSRIGSGHTHLLILLPLTPWASGTSPSEPHLPPPQYPPYLSPYATSVSRINICVMSLAVAYFVRIWTYTSVCICIRSTCSMFVKTVWSSLPACSCQRSTYTWNSFLPNCAHSTSLDVDTSRH